ncbi:MAG: hypothetical protein ACI4XM_06080, partial [Candidatus Coprovivens sp.]
MGLFDKMKNKTKEQVTPVAAEVDNQVPVEATQAVVQQEQPLQEEIVVSQPTEVVPNQPVYDNVFNADGSQIVEQQVVEVPLQELQIQNVSEPVINNEGLPIPEETAATIDNPLPAVSPETEIQVNPQELFEGGLTIEDEITQLVNEVVTQELSNENIQSSEISNMIEQPIIEETPIVTEQPVIEQPIVEETPIVTEQPVIEQPIVEETPIVTEQPVIEQTIIEETPIVAEQPVIEQPIVEETPIVAEQPVVEQPIVEETPIVAEQPVIEQPIVEETPIVAEQP